MESRAGKKAGGAQSSPVSGPSEREHLNRPRLLPAHGPRSMATPLLGSIILNLGCTPWGAQKILMPEPDLQRFRNTLSGVQPGQRKLSKLPREHQNAAGAESSLSYCSLRSQALLGGRKQNTLSGDSGPLSILLPGPFYLTTQS